MVSSALLIRIVQNIYEYITVDTNKKLIAQVLVNSFSTRMSHLTIQLQVVCTPR